MPNWILRLAASWGYPWIISASAQYLRQNKAVLAALSKHRSGGTFLEIARSYAAVTPEITDDRIVEGIEQLRRDLTVMPFNELVKTNPILVMFGQIKIPDFDGNADNDVSIGEELGTVVDKVFE